LNPLLAISDLTTLGSPDLGWIELLVGGDLPIGLRGVPRVELAIDYFGTMLAIAKQNPEVVGKPVPWAESQTRSALNQIFGTKWFSSPTPENNRPAV
jgi:hypothetical protein